MASVAVAALAASVLVGLADAGLDPGFGAGPQPGVVQVAPVPPFGAVAVATLADGSVVLAQPNEVRKYTGSGVLDTSFGSAGVVNVPALAPVSVDLDGSGRILVTGSRTDTGIGGSSDPVIVRMSSAGVIDPGFSGSIPSTRFRISRPFEIGASISVTSYEPTTGRACIHRLRASDGQPDGTFGSAGDACVDGLGLPGANVPISGAIGGRRANGTYVLAVLAVAPGSGDVSGTAIRLVSLSSTGAQTGTIATIPAVAGEYLLAGVFDADDSLLVSGQRNSFNDGFVRKYQHTTLDATFAANGPAPGVASLPGLRIERLVILPDRRLLALGWVSGAGQVRLLTADGRADGALDPGASAPDRLTLPRGQYAGFTPNAGFFWDADLTTSGRVVLGGTEARRIDLGGSDDTSVIARSGVLGPPSPILTPGGVVPVVPERLLDTRPATQVGYAGPKPGRGSVVRLQVTGVGRTQVPSSATAVILTVTGTEATDDGFVTVWPCGAERPVASNLNLVRNGTRPNVVISGLTDGAVCLFTQSGAHLLADVTGYLASAREFVPVTPRRLLDTRPDTQVGFTGSKPGAGSIVTLQVAGGTGLAPTGTPAVVLNLTATEVERGTFVTAWDCGPQRPQTSNLNAGFATTVPNLVVAPVSAAGTVCLYTLSPTHLIADLAGWLPTGASYLPVAPDRLLDTRGPGSIGYTGPTPGAGAVVEVQVTGRAGVPADATAVVLNAVGVDAPAAGFVTVWPCGAQRPVASNLNLELADAAANVVVTGIGTDGKVCLFTQSGAELVVDVFGAFAPR
jgi:hypothetical protein